jgi:hypothetical protein
VSDDNPTIITGIIDWQSTSIEPAFVYAHETPDFAAPLDDDALSENADEPANETDEEKRLKKDAELCNQVHAKTCDC